MNLLLSELSGALPQILPPRRPSPSNVANDFPFPGNMAGGFVQQSAPLIGVSDSAWHQEYIWPVSPFRKPPQSEGIVSEFLAKTRVNWEQSYKQVTAGFERLKTQYIFRNEEVIVRFLSGHRAAATLLSNAVPELKKSFGQDAVFNLEALSEDDDSTSLYAVVVWRGSAHSAEAALENFDERWWLNQKPEPGLSFTYELA